MQRFLVALVLSVASFAAAAETPPPSVHRIVPIREVIDMAATFEGQPVHATIELVVRGAGLDQGVIFLNSENDYRDQRNIAIAILPEAVADLERRFGANLRESMLGKRIRVEGFPRRVTIWFNCQGRRTDKYYYQTHLPVTDGQQVQLVLGE